MKCACPACGRITTVETDVGDFPTRCHRCGAMLRPSSEAGIELAHPSRAEVLPFSLDTLGRGGLAGMLSAKPATVAVAAPPVVVKDAASVRIAHSRVYRQKALHRAQLRGTVQALGLLGTVGFGLIALVGISALVMGAHSWMHGTSHPGPARSEMAQASEPSATR